MAYLAFAREEPAYYEAMFNSGACSDESMPQMDDTGFQLLQQSLIAQFGGDAQQARKAAFLVFALSHGIASLTKPGASQLPKGAPPAEFFLKEGVAALLRGMTDGKGLNSPVPH